MSIPNRQIGWSNESNLLWQIAKQIERLTGVTSKLIPSGAEVVTKAQVDTLIGSNSLVPGTTYIISGVDVPLYGGTTVILQAETTNKLALAGHGLFYNPRYLNSQLTPNNGYGIWSNYMTITMSNIVGTFYNGNTVTANNGATAIYLAKNFFQWVSGNWSAATSISNGSGATANVTGGVSPSYAIGQDVIWGGKHWTNVTGNVGTATNKYTLSADWAVVPFNDVDYDVVADIIHYDYEHDLIIRRKDKWNNDVDSNYETFYIANNYNLGNPIKDFQWGNGPEDFDFSYQLGVTSNYVKDSYLECINFIGQQLSYNTLTQTAFIWNIISDKNSLVSQNIITTRGYATDVFYTGMYNIVLTNSELSGNLVESECNIYNIYLTNGYFINNELTNGSEISQNTIVDSEITYNKLNRSSIQYNTLTSNGNVIANTLTVGSINQNTITNNSFVRYNILNSTSTIIYNTINDGTVENNTLNNSSRIDTNVINSFVDGNDLDYNSKIQYNNIDNQSAISGNTLTLGSNIYSNTLTYSGLSYNNLYNTYIEFGSLLATNSLNRNEIEYNILNNSNLSLNNSGSLVNKKIRYIEVKESSVLADLSTATIIYGDYSKQIFKNSAGTVRLGYYNASDVFTVVNVNA